MVNGKHQEAEEMNQADHKLVTRIVSKEASKANSSCRVYYGSSGAIPFVWESQPGTPKHILADYDSSNLPPLTPPPSYYSTSMPKSKRYGNNGNSFFIKPNFNFLKALIFPAKALSPKMLNHSPSFSMSSANSSSLSSTSSSSWSSIKSSPSLSRSKRFKKLRCFSCSKLFVRCITYADDDANEREKIRGGSVQFRGCYSIGSMKSALLSVVGHGSR